jgi:predicted amidophosphoribosyltransferase
VGDAVGTATGAAARILATLVDLVLPADCVGCGAAADSFGTAISGICTDCSTALAGPPVQTRPSPAPDGLPPCFAGGGYEGSLRELILAYKERGRRGLVAPLGDVLAGVVAAGAMAWAPSHPLVLVPVPATAVAIRARQGDHMLRLADRARRRLRRAGWPAVVAAPLCALPRADSVHLNRLARGLAAQAAFAVHPGRLRKVLGAAEVGATFVVVDDVVTTGSTLAAVATRLAANGIQVSFAATLAATRLRSPPAEVAVRQQNQRQTDDMPSIAQIFSGRS